MKKFRTIALSILSICTGLLFIYSAYTKTLPIQVFEYTLVEYVHLPWLLATFGSRILVGLEAGLGLLLLTNAYGRKKYVLKIAVALLAAFSIYLVVLWVTVGNNVNCGCFGDVIWMSPSTSLLKNLFIMIALIVLIRYHTGLNYKMVNIITIPLLIAISFVPFITEGLPDTTPDWLNKEKYTIDLSALYKPEKKDKPTVELRSGKHIIAFLSLTCPHCKMAAYKLQLMTRNNPRLPIFFVLNGDDSNLKPFWDKTKSEHIPHSKLAGADFINLSGFNLPAIYWINNSIVEAKTNYITLDQAQIEEWLQKP